MAAPHVPGVRTVRGAGRRGALALVAGLVGLGGVAVIAPPASAGEAHADLSVSVGFAPGAPKTGEEVTFTVTATNDGPDTANDVALGLGFDYPFQVVDTSGGECLTTQFDRITVICTVGDLASGAQASATIVARSLSSGLFLLPAVVSSPTDDPDVEDQGASTSILVRPGPSVGERWVRGEWPTIMQREADAGGVSYWGKRFTAAIIAYPPRISSVAFEILQSNEYRRLRIREAYERILDRAADPGALIYWLGQLAGGMSYETFERRLLTSSEFTRNNQVGPGQTALRNRVDATFQALLGRDATLVEREAIVRDVLARRTWGSVVLGIQRSGEYAEVLAQHYFQLVLDRDADALAKYVWKLRLGQGLSPELMFARLLTSDAVMRDYPRTNDDYGIGPEFSTTRATDFTDAFPEKTE